MSRSFGYIQSIDYTKLDLQTGTLHNCTINIVVDNPTSVSITVDKYFYITTDPANNTNCHYGGRYLWISGEKTADKSVCGNRSDGEIIRTINNQSANGRTVVSIGFDYKEWGDGSEVPYFRLRYTGRK